MADKRTSGLTALSAIAVGDLFMIVDISDTSMGPGGTNKKVTNQDFLYYLGGTLSLGTDATGVAAGRGVKITAEGILKANRGGGSRSEIVCQDVGSDSVGLGSGENVAGDGHVKFYTAGTFDTSIRRAAAGVLFPSDSTATPGPYPIMWMQNAGHTRVSGAAVTNGTVTPGNITGLTATVKAGRKYGGFLALTVSNTVAVDGIRLDFDGGGCTITSFWAGVSGAGVPAATWSVSQSAALATDLIATTMADTNRTTIIINFAFLVANAGTFIPRVALEALSTGVISVHIDSHMLIWDIP